jgi:aspartyl-tRNA(Asn)/glutamyl-tRNA(Gln) amidotransferase subunit A
MSYFQYSIKELHNKLVSKEISAKDLYDESISAIDHKNEKINAFIDVFEGSNIPDSIEPGLLLAGIPVAMKDNILFKGRPMTAASSILKGYIATYDSKIAEIFHQQNALVIGRVNMDEFAMGSSTETSCYGITRNPLDLERVPGGSSGGSAAAVAAGMAVYALGSDTGGSIRQPASYCGLVGLKPTYGAVSRNGLVAMASSLDCIGPITKTVEDAEVVFDIIAQHDVLDATSISYEKREFFQEKNINKKVIGVPRAFLKMDGIDPEVLANFNESLEIMKDIGYHIVDIELPTIHHSLAVYYILQPAEASSNLARFDGIRYGLSKKGIDLTDGYIQTKTHGFGNEVKRRIMLGAHVLSSGYHDEYYYKALALRAKITDEVHAIFDTIDVIATPTVPNVAFKIGSKKNNPIEMYLEDIFTVPYNLTGNPAISIPSGNNSEGMPFGMHLTTSLFCEKKLFEIGKDFEKIVNYSLTKKK